MNTNIPNLNLLALLPAAMLVITSCSSTPKAPPPAEEKTGFSYQEGVPGGVLVNTLKMSVRVTAIDKTERKATVQGPDGEEFIVKVGPDAVNFDQVRVGDLVNATVTEQLVVSVNDKDAPPVGGESGVVLLAPKGARPGGIAAGTTTATATVTAIDQEKRTATMRFEDGSTKTYHVRSDVDLKKRKVGEQVTFRVTQRIAINVEKP
jgi:hypothetical protein